MSILQPKSALATMFVILKSAIFSFKFKAFETSLMAALAAFSASDQLSEPIIIILPDLKTKIVLLGLVFLIITAGNLFLLYLHPQAFYAISLRSKTSDSIFILAKETTFWTKGVFVFVWLFQAIQWGNDSSLLFKSFKYFLFEIFYGSQHLKLIFLLNLLLLVQFDTKNVIKRAQSPERARFCRQTINRSSTQAKYLWQIPNNKVIQSKNHVIYLFFTLLQRYIQVFDLKYFFKANPYSSVEFSFIFQIIRKQVWLSSENKSFKDSATF